jgi:hypothetical protein
LCVCVRERGRRHSRDEERSRDEAALRPPLRLQLDRSAKREEICAAWISKTERKKWGNEAFWFSVMKYLYHKRSSLSLSLSLSLSPSLGWFIPSPCHGKNCLSLCSSKNRLKKFAVSKRGIVQQQQQQHMEFCNIPLPGSKPQSVTIYVI